MDTKSTNFWWLKSPSSVSQNIGANRTVSNLNSDNSHSLVDLMEQDKDINADSDVDVGSIIEEINRVAAQSPLGPYEKIGEERDIEDLMKEAERIYMESSKSFEQLSQRSKTSQNITDLLSNFSKNSTPTPRSVSPLPMDPDPDSNSSSESEPYTEDFSEESKMESNLSPSGQNSAKLLKSGVTSSTSENNFKSIYKDASQSTSNSMTIPKSKSASFKDSIDFAHIKQQDLHRNEQFQLLQEQQQEIMEKQQQQELVGKQQQQQLETIIESKIVENIDTIIHQVDEDNERKFKSLNELLEIKNSSIKTLEETNQTLQIDIQKIKLELQKTNTYLDQTKEALAVKTISSPVINLELEKALEELKDSKEVNTALQLQLDTVNKSHQYLRSSYDDLMSTNKNLDRRLVELESSLDKYKNELLNLQKTKDKLLENEVNLNKVLEIEKLQSKSLKLQNEKDAKCIQDLNRQIKEMERIIARKHPDSVSALIVAAKENATDKNLTARKLLEDRIKTLEQEQFNRETQSSKVFLEIQEKFNQMKAKYENHIEDLELHVSDLKNQLKRKIDTYDVYTQTICDGKIPQKETFTVFTQTDPVLNKQKPPPTKKMTNETHKEDIHLLATIRGLQADLMNKEKVITKLQKEIDELKKTNRRLQKEREGSLKNLSDRKEFRSYPEKLSHALTSRSNSEKDVRKEEETQQLKSERDKLKQQLKRIEEDYHALKTKRIEDLTALQEAHEREIGNYVTSVTPLKEQLELQHVSITTLQSQLSAAKQELAVVTVERDHLNNRVLSIPHGASDGDSLDVESLLKKIAFLEKRYEEREYRLRAIVQSLAQKSVMNRSCEQCAERQQQLIAYKVELDQLLATVRALQ